MPHRGVPRPHILLVEDEAVLAELGRRHLEAEGFQVTVHTSSLQALDDYRLRPSAFDAVVTDNSMPRLSGTALAHELLRIRPDAQILLVSGLAETLDDEAVLRSGIRALLGKPHTGQELVTAVRALLGPSRLPRDHVNRG